MPYMLQGTVERNQKQGVRDVGLQQPVCSQAQVVQQAMLRGLVCPDGNRSAAL